MHVFDAPRYQELATRHKEPYRGADPFPHVVIDDFLPAGVGEKILEEFPTPHRAAWDHIDSYDQKKLAAQEEVQLGECTRELLREFNSPGCLRFLEALTGISGLIPDPYFEGGGLHQIERGGYLKVHADFNWHRRLSLDRRLNLILYLNKDWHEDYKGHLELWDRTMSHCVRKVLPVYNRCVIFNTTSWAYHGHPEKLACPPDRTRKSLALYYYTSGRPAEELGEKHGTLWQERPARRGFRRLVANALHASAT